MVQGVITARDLILHPFSSIEAFGMMKYLKLLVRCCDRKHICLIELIWK